MSTKPGLRWPGVFISPGILEPPSGSKKTDRSTDGHCDCAFRINYYRWCWPDIGALIAPRSLLMASGSEDILWRPIGYRDVANRIRLQYAALGADKHFDLVEDLAPHGYTPKLRRTIFTWFNAHLKNDSTPVTDDVTDFVEPGVNPLVFVGKLPEQDVLRQEPVTGPVAVYGDGYTASLAIYAAILDSRITEIVLAAPPASHEDPTTPEFLGVLRIGDLPHNLALAYPSKIKFVGEMPEAYTWTRQLYETLGAGDKIRVIDHAHRENSVSRTD